jgi:L-ascorbate metabolism protein UlaG (beta-lactamase superfamily)
MQIIWNGQSCFTIKSKTSVGEESIVLINPFDEKQSGIKISKSKANIVLLGNKNSKLDKKKVDDNFFLIDKPGEFEVKGIFINGIADKWAKKDPKQNILFFLEIEGIKILHLGEITDGLENGSLDKLSGIDVLMIPVGGGDNINAEKAIEIINEIEPRIIIPMNFKIPGLKEKVDSVDKFAKEMGINPKEQTDRLRVDKRNLPQDNTEIIIMSKK